MLEHVIKSKRPGILSDGIILLHDNARPNATSLVRDTFRDLAGKHFNILRTVQIFPLVIYAFFGDLKKDIRGRLFHSDEEVQEWVKL